MAGPPYVSNAAAVGGRPTVDLDIPIVAVLIALYLCGAISNMTIYQLNLRRAHKFKKSLCMFGFCMSRVVTCVLRLVWATRPNNVRIAIAAQIFNSAGVLIVYVIVLLLCRNVLRATRPRLGGSKGLGILLKVLYASLFCALVLVISFTILTFYTLDTTLRTVALWVQRGAILYILLFNVLSLVLLVLAILLPPSPNSYDFGSGSMKSKKVILSVAVFCCLFIAGFRAGTAWTATRPASDPAWFDSKPAFYVILFGTEILVIYLFILTRFDRRFYMDDKTEQQNDDFSMASRRAPSIASSTTSSKKDRLSVYRPGTDEEPLEA